VFLAVPRNLLSPSLLLLALVGCAEGEGHYTDLYVSVDSHDVVSLHLQGKHHGDARAPCPPSVSGTARVNGIAMKQTDSGGGEYIPDSDREYCLGLAFELDGKLLPADTKTLEITFDPLRAHGREYEPARAWHVTADWKTDRVWTEDDLAARMQANEEFEVRWTAQDAEPPTLSLSAYALGSWGAWLAARVALVSSEPGKARYRFDGPEPIHVWSLEATVSRKLTATRCSGLERCSVNGWFHFALTPGGVEPASQDSYATPRECIALPGADGSRYSSPEWSEFPDLSTLQVARRSSCTGADLYFVLLGACGVCGGGKSTYVVGNRGTDSASFSVRSNLETVDGAVLEPQQFSEPFEISFDGALSELEILSDDDCDRGSNVARVASIVCEGDGTRALLPTGCNNTCGL
jgi:hypothetical protein